MNQTPRPQSQFDRPDIRFDAGRHDRAKLGFVLLAMEQTIEDDMFKLAPPGVGVHFSRASMANKVDVDTLSDMAEGIGAAAALLLPDGQLDVACYACTSGSVVIGEDRVFAELQRGAPGRASPPDHLGDAGTRRTRDQADRDCHALCPTPSTRSSAATCSAGSTSSTSKGSASRMMPTWCASRRSYIHEFARSVDRAWRRMPSSSVAVRSARSKSSPSWRRNSESRLSSAIRR